MTEAPFLPALPMREGTITLARLIELYLAHYTGRDDTRTHRLAWWASRLGSVTLQELNDDHVAAAMDELSSQSPRYFAGRDADGNPIFKIKTRRRPLASGTLNRYINALAAVITWAIKRRIAPKGYDHPCRRVERQPESPGVVRYLSEDEQQRLLAACKASSWPRLYAMVLLALTTGARKSEVLGLRWSDVDLEGGLVHVGRSKNGDPKVLPLVPAVADALRPHRGAPTALVFPSRRNPQQRFHYEPLWHAALAQAKVKNFRFHDLRHSCASHLAQRGATLLEIADLLGHRQLAMTKRYAHLSAANRRDLVLKHMGDFA